MSNEEELVGKLVEKLNIITKQYNRDDIKKQIEELELIHVQTKEKEDVIFVDVSSVIKLENINNKRDPASSTISSPFCTVEENTIKIWFHKNENAMSQVSELPLGDELLQDNKESNMNVSKLPLEYKLLVVSKLPQEYDSSVKMWNFYDVIYNKMINEIYGVNIQEIPLSWELKTKNKKKYYRFFKKINDITFGGDVDFNFNEENLKYFKKVVEDDNLCAERFKKEIYNMLDCVKNHHHSIENVSIMSSGGNLQGTKQCIGNDRFDVMAYALNEYCKGNTALLFAKCTPENQKILKNFMNSICNDPKENKPNLNLYFNRIYNIDDEDLIQDLIESGKRAIDSAQRVQEYIALAYRVWIHRSKKYDEKYYQVLIEKINLLPSGEEFNIKDVLCVKKDEPIIQDLENTFHKKVVNKDIDNVCIARKAEASSVKWYKKK